MRPWPPLQIAIALLFLAAAGAGMIVLSSGPDDRAHKAAEPLPGGLSAPVRERIHVSLESTAPVRFTGVSWEGRPLAPPEGRVRSWSSRFEGSPGGLLRVAGTADSADLPVAVRVEVEPGDRPIRETVRWVRSPEFRFLVPPDQR